MKHLKSYKLFESNDNDITFVRNILLDMSDDDISIKVSDLKEYSPNSPVKKISILIGDDEDELSEIFFDISKYIETLELINNYLTGEGYSLEFSHFLYFDEDGMVTNSFHSSNFNEIKDKLKNITQLKICEIIYKDIELKETIKVPIEIGDTVLGGRFKNKKIVVKKIGKNKKGDITINDKPLLKFRLVKENLQEDVDYYFRHLEDDNFVIQTENDYFRIFKPINQSNDRGSLVYSYSNCNPFQWSEIAGEISRYVIELDDSENSEKSIEYAYIVKKEGGISNRKQIHTQMLLDDTFDCGEILSFTIGFR